MRIAVMADIHSNNAALEACISDAKRNAVSDYIIAGDLISDWHEPNEVLNTVKNLTNNVIQGNREEYFSMQRDRMYGNLWNKYDQYASLLWTFERLPEAQLDYIDSLKSTISLCPDGQNKIRVVHGSVFSNSELMYRKYGSEPVIKSLKAIRENILIFAHTHEQYAVKISENNFAVNPGSVGVHFNNQGAAEYCILEFVDGKVDIIFRKVKYDLYRYAKKLMASSLYQKAYVWFLVNYMGMVGGHNYLIDFFDDIKSERERVDVTTKGPIPNDVLYKVFEEKYSDKIQTLFIR